MKHPIIKYFNDCTNIDLFKLSQTDIYNISSKNNLDFKNAIYFVRLGRISKEIKKSNVPHIIIESDEWKSKVSKDTIKKIGFDNFKFPFDHFSIENDDSICFFTKFTEANENLKIDGFFCAIAKKDVDAKDPENTKVYHISKDKFEDAIDFLGEDFFASILYFTTFKNDTRRVLNPTIYTAKKSKGTPKHKFRVIKLHQPVTNKQRYSTERKKSEFSWIVRGHWRQQPYLNGTIKPKWIDSYWKGKGKEKLEKVYKV